MEPENVEVLEMAGAVFLETGDIDKAKSVSFKCDMFIISTHRLCLFLVTVLVSFLFLFKNSY